MRNMKTLIRLMGAVSLSTTAASSVVACGAGTKQVPNLNSKYATLLNSEYATLLRWYESGTKKSLITQKLNDDYTNIVLNNNVVTNTSFSTSLLEQNKAKTANAAAFLKELGYTSGSEYKDYSTNDVAAITALKAIVKSSNPGKIIKEENSSYFEVATGTSQVDIMSEYGVNGKLIKSYIVNAVRNRDLNIYSLVMYNLLHTNKKNLKLTAEEVFQQEQPVSKFKLVLNETATQEKFDNLVTLLNTTVSTKFYSVDDDTEITGNFPNTKVYLKIFFSKVLVAKINCEIPLTTD